MHIILERAKRYDIQTSGLTPCGASYDKSRGYWIRDGAGDAYVAAEGAPSVSKKCDRETGEDQKGE